MHVFKRVKSLIALYLIYLSVKINIKLILAKHSERRGILKATHHGIFVKFNLSAVSVKLDFCIDSFYFDELLKNEHPDSVHICTPHYLHTDYAIKALHSGINVLTEKPCSVSADEVEYFINDEKIAKVQVNAYAKVVYNS